jgi:hypothetical protein
VLERILQDAVRQPHAGAQLHEQDPRQRIDQASARLLAVSRRTVRIQELPGHPQIVAAREAVVRSEERAEHLHAAGRVSVELVPALPGRLAVVRWSMSSAWASQAMGPLLNPPNSANALLLPSEPASLQFAAAPSHQALSTHIS